MGVVGSVWEVDSDVLWLGFGGVTRVFESSRVRGRGNVSARA